MGVVWEWVYCTWCCDLRRIRNLRLSECWMYHVNHILIGLLLLIIIRWIYSRRVYGKSQSLLNAPDGTLWQNMGYWTPGSTFKESCEALTRMVLSAVDLRSSDTLLDFGYGCGEEIKFIDDHYAPRSINGCTFDARQSITPLKQD